MLAQCAAMPLAAPALAILTDAAVAGDGVRAGWAAVAVAVLAVLALTAGHFAHVFYFELGERVQLAVERDLIDLANGSAGLEHHERPDYADRLRVLRQELDWAGWTSMEILFSAVGLAVGVSITATLLATLDPVLLLLPAFAIPSLLLGRKAEALMGDAREAAAPHTRRLRHLVRLATDAGPAKEVRACGLGGELRERQRATWGQATDILVAGERRSALLQVSGQLVFAVAYIAATLLVVRSVVAGRGTVGDVVLVISLAAQVNQQATAAVTLLVGLQRIARTLGNLQWVRELVLAERPAPDRELPATIREGITLRGVDFAYPGTERVVLGGVDLHLPAGRTVAIVGENGAGKSTLVKLLCRFYEASEGVIELDGTDVRRFPLEAWRERIAAGFQDFARFEFLARETIGLGDLPRIGDDSAVRDALHRARGDDLLDRLDAGLDTQLGKQNADGTELSGGQWQKLALGRAMMRTEPLLLVLDEPTSALDAQAEHELFERYAASAKRVAQRTGAVTVLVSHRFSTVRMADLILVVADGRISESGSHAELIAAGGLYAELYGMQAAAYR
ncbi:MAG: ABC transporter ATP-binding protein [Actinomycetales bacterium]|nr:ABC transporter ATP-binding protein [Actinomycetales bacterium]